MGKNKHKKNKVTDGAPTSQRNDKTGVTEGRAFAKGFFSNPFWDLIGIKSAGESMTEHALSAKKKGRFLAVALVFFVAFFGCGLFIRGCYDDAKIRAAERNSSNSELLIKTYKSQIDTANNQIIQLKVDANEVARSKDAEISKLASERNATLARLSLLETSGVLQFSTNFDAALTNVFSAALNANAPDENLIINGIRITRDSMDFNSESFNPTNLIVIPILKDRIIQIATVNSGKVTATHCNVDFIPLVTVAEYTNFNAVGLWRLLPPAAGVFSNNSHTMMYPHWIAEAVHPDPPETIQPCDPIFISTNYTQPALLAYVRVYSDNSPMKAFRVVFWISALNFA
jgi:hypothetical protein